jgi:metal-responsive CopG/Arc/MetJ family transcriptional regulator
MQVKKRGGKKKYSLIAVWLPADLLGELDKEVAARDTDRSKLIRQALREKLGRVALRNKLSQSNYENTVI